MITIPIYNHYFWHKKLLFLLDCNEIDLCLDKLATHNDGLFFLLWRLVSWRPSSKDEQPLTTPDRLHKILREVKSDPNPPKAPIDSVQHELVMQDWWEKDPQEVAGKWIDGLYGALPDSIEGFNNLLEKILLLRHDRQSTVDEDGTGMMKDIRRMTAEEARLYSLDGQVPLGYYAQFQHRRDLVEYVVMTLHSDFGGPNEFAEKMSVVGTDEENGKERADLKRKLEELAKTDRDKFNLSVLELLELAPNASDHRNKRDIWGKLDGYLSAMRLMNAWKSSPRTKMASSFSCGDC